ncbi:MAG: ATP-binding protein [Desulfomonilaceae bacterium]
MDKIKNHIYRGNPSCFLVSGYRGVGKTSFLRKIQEEIESEAEKSGNHGLFVWLSVPKYKNYAVLLRHFIRNIYSEIYSRPHLIKKFDGCATQILPKIQSLYDQTFYDISVAQKKTFLVESEKGIKVETIVRSTVLLILAQILMLFLNKFGIMDSLARLLPFSFTSTGWSAFKSIVKLWPILLAMILTLKYTYSYSEKKKNLSEVGRKTLFDDEIAEVRLTQVLSDLGQSGMKVIIIIDEVDKLNPDEIKQLTTELKPIMLSGLATFIIVSGQELYYKMETEQALHDPEMVSIFSNLIHVPLLSVEAFDILFRKIVEFPRNQPPEMLKHFVDSLVLQSNRIPRRFVNLIGQEVFWEHEISYLLIKDEFKDRYQTDSSLLRVINKIELDRISNTKMSEAIRDFFSTQLYLWVKKLQEMGNSTFTVEQVYNTDSDFPTNIPSWYALQLKGLAEVLVEKLVEEELIDEIPDQAGEKTGAYKWSEKASLPEEPSVSWTDKQTSRFLTSYIGLEKMLRAINSGVIPLQRVVDSSRLDSRPPVTNIISNLRKEGVLDHCLLEPLKRFTYLRNRVVHGEPLLDEDSNSIKNSVPYSSLLMHDLILSYCAYLATKILPNDLTYEVNYRLLKEETVDKPETKFDLLATHYDAMSADVMIQVEVGHFSSLFLSDYGRKLRARYDQHNRQTAKNNFLMVLVHLYNERPINISNLRNIIADQFADMPEYVYTFVSSTDESHDLVVATQKIMSGISLSNSHQSGIS